MPEEFTNALANETSPYLLQHAHNPVNWQPWGPVALEEARHEDKPIFLSIGYAACHWCHVMEHESFEDEEVARILNENYVSIKVDREERPDLDEIYMAATMMFSGGQGGWPMSVFLAPDLTPFFAGTYFPKESLYGRPGFKTVLTQLLTAWRTRRDDIESNRPKVIAALEQIHSAEGDGDLLSRERVTAAAEAIRRAFEPSHGGMPSGTNKFPPSQAMDLLLREYSENGYAPCLNAVELTLEKMARGGIYDHLGGGIARYSTDLKWLVPHFEKMLYDQALVSAIYLDGYQVTANQELRKLCAATTRGIFDYVLRDLTSPDGAFYSSEDADSEGLEGKFYIWTLDEVLEIVGEEDGRIFASHYGVTEYGNWDHPGDDHVPHGPKNILHVSRPAETIAKLNGIEIERVEAALLTGREKLFEARRKRVRPGLDDKILTGWDGLMISALAKGAAVLDEPGYGEAAARAADFILRELRSGGRLLATYGKGRARLSAYSTDYAFFIDGLLGLYEWDGKPHWLDAAEELLDTSIEHYWDQSSGGFYFTAGDHEELLIRSKTANDGAIPSANSVMLANLQRLAILLDRNDLRDKAADIIRVFGAGTGRAPFQHERLLCGIQAWRQGFVEIVIVGDPADERTRALERAVYSTYLPNKIVAKLNPAEPPARDLPLLANRTLVDGHPAAYVCRDYACKLPVTEPGELRRQLLESAKTALPVDS